MRFRKWRQCLSGTVSPQPHTIYSVQTLLLAIAVVWMVVQDDLRLVHEKYQVFKFLAVRHELADALADQLHGRVQASGKSRTFDHHQIMGTDTGIKPDRGIADLLLQGIQQHSCVFARQVVCGKIFHHHVVVAGLQLHEGTAQGKLVFRKRDIQSQSVKRGRPAVISFRAIA